MSQMKRLLETGVARELRCSCCGGYAGRWRQWPNRDTGYGVCAPCIKWMRERIERGVQTDDLARNYGVAGINYEGTPKCTTSIE